MAGFLKGDDSDVSSPASRPRTLTTPGRSRSSRRTPSRPHHPSEKARIAWEAELAKASRLNARQAAQLAAQTASSQSQFRATYQANSQAEDTLNHRALNRWLDYLDRVADAGSRAPERPRAAPCEAADEAVSTSCATRRGGPCRVSPDWTLRRRIPRGTPRRDHPCGLRGLLPRRLVRRRQRHRSCGLRAVACWPRRGAPPGRRAADSLGQWREPSLVPKQQLQVGDLLVLGSNKSGLTGSGVYLGDDLVIASDAEAGHVAVRRVAPGEMYGARRAAAQQRDARGAGRRQLRPRRGRRRRRDELAGPPALPRRRRLVLDVRRLRRQRIALVVRIAHWPGLLRADRHAGLRLADGVVSLETNAWAGTLVRIDHGGGVETWYAHMDTVGVTDGQIVSAGNAIGTVGSRGNSTGPHLHFELRLDGSGVDPMAVLTPTSFADGGAFVNGAIPDSALCSATSGGIQSLRCDAAVAFRILSAEYATELGTELCITDSYRSRALQEHVTRPSRASPPSPARPCTAGASRSTSAAGSSGSAPRSTSGWSATARRTAGSTRLGRGGRQPARALALRVRGLTPTPTFPAPGPGLGVGWPLPASVQPSEGS